MPNDNLRFNGGHFLPSEQGRISLERLHRDALAQQYLVSKQVLDVAYAEGCGSALLLQDIPSVVGANIAQEGIEHAVLTYASSTLSFEEGSMIALHVEANSFDLTHLSHRANANRDTNA